MNNEEDKKIDLGVPHETVKLTDALAQNKDLNQKTNTVRTFQTDIAGTVKSDNVSMIKMALAEKSRQEREGSSLANVDIKYPIKKAYIWALIGIIVVAGGVGFVYWFFNRPPAETIERKIAPQEPEIIYSETQAVININDKPSSVIIEELKKEVSAKLDLGTIKRVMLTAGTSSTRSIETSEFFNVIRSNAPNSLIRSLESYFVLGAYSFAPHDAFLIFKIKSYDDAFSAMLQWEPYIEIDLGKILIEETTPPNTIINQPVATTTFATTTGSTTIRSTNDPNKSVFGDKILQNKDTRILTGPDGKIKLLYSFIDKNTLVIVSSEKGFKELITRMTTGRIRR